MKLSELKVGQHAVIQEITAFTDESVRYRLLDLGLVPGEEVKMLKKSPIGDPVTISVQGYSLSLRLTEAAHVELKDIHVADDCDENEPSDISYLGSLHDHNAHPGYGEEGIFHTSHEKPLYPVGTPLHYAIIGQPNAGTTTLFNLLTGENNHVSNAVGTTTTIATAKSKIYPDLTISDLPGVYSLANLPFNNGPSRQFLTTTTPLHAIINIVDINTIERSLYLTMQLLQLHIPMVLALNMADENVSSGTHVMVNKLESMLGVPVVMISASKNQGIDELLEHCEHLARYGEKPEAGGDLHDVWDPVGSFEDYAAVAEKRYEYIKNIYKQCVIHQDDNPRKKFSDRLDRYLLESFVSLPIFLGVMILSLWLTIDVIGASLQDLIDKGVKALGAVVVANLQASGVHEAVVSMVDHAIFGGVGAVLAFMPIIVTMFFFIALMEDSGYMSRIAYLSDRLLRRVGLSGRSIVPMLIGFGCSVPAIMATRTLPSSRDRRMTIMMIPFMSCSAKIAIYAYFTSFLFPGKGGIVLACLYLTSIAVGILVAIARKLMFPHYKPAPFVMELPVYRLPSIKSVGHLLWDKVKDFIQTAFTVIFVATICIWFLRSFDMSLHYITDPSSSILAAIAGCLTPLFAPIGLGDWAVVTSLITGVIAKEGVVSTMSLLGIADTLNFAQAMSMLVFCLLYTPCVAALATIKRELGLGWCVFIALFQCVIAWLAALCVYLIF